MKERGREENGEEEINFIPRAYNAASYAGYSEPSVLFYNASGFITSAYSLTLSFAIAAVSS